MTWLDGWISAVVNINSLERDGLHQAELCPRHTMKMKTQNILIPDPSLDWVMRTWTWIPWLPPTIQQWLMQPVRYLVRNAAGKSHGSPKMFSTSVMRGEIWRRSGMKQKEQKNTGKQTQGSYRREKAKFPDISLTFPWHKFKFPWRKRSAIGKTYLRLSCYLLWDNSFDSCNLGIFYVLQRHFTI